MQTESDRYNEEQKLREAYAAVFNNGSGQTVLNDLFRAFGFTPDGIENPSFTGDCPTTTVIHREGMKEPVRHILAMLRYRLRP
ncbi:hypothetical protein OpiT1DRAFT_03851 [Opitutaceae bacterium TAV1]|nr:hypothetical protein OpiT1DRAFT_03851 [Opitutaceae bacterium TAV1]